MLGTRITLLRRRRNLTLDELARRTGLNIEYMKRLEGGNINRVNGGDLLALIEVLGIKDAVEFAYLNNLNRIPLRFKAINVSLPKTGTTSIHGMFAGNYRSRHEFMYRQSAVNIAGYRNGRMTRDEFRTFVRYRDIQGHLEMDSASFNNYFIDVLAEEFPEAKFLYVIRDCYSWVDSVINMYLKLDFPTRRDTVRARLMNEFTLSWFGLPLPERHEAAGKGKYVLDNIEGLFRAWSEQNSRVINRIPRDRSLMLKTHQLSRNAAKIADFLDIPLTSLDTTMSHLFQASERYHVLEEMNPVQIKEMSKRYCGELMNEYFPGFEFDDFRKGRMP